MFAGSQLGIPDLQISGAGCGVTVSTDSEGTVLPRPLALAATWNEKLAHEFGEVIGREARASACLDGAWRCGKFGTRTACGTHLREPRRYLVLAGKMVAAEIRGIQTHSVEDIKHTNERVEDRKQRQRDDVLLAPRSAPAPCRRTRRPCGPAPPRGRRASGRRAPRTRPAAARRGRPPHRRRPPVTPRGRSRRRAGCAASRSPCRWTGSCGPRTAGTGRSCAPPA